jgi:MFS family permease
VSAAAPRGPRASLRRAAERPRYRFAAVFGASATTFLAIGAVITVLPRYVVGPVGGGDLAVGIVVGAFAFSAIVSRPFAGRLADARGRRVVVVAGSALMALAGTLYFLPLGVPGLVLARLVLGCGEGLVFTAGATWTVDLAPPDRRGQAIGLFGLAIWGGLSVGPPLGEALLALGDYGTVWAFAIAAPVVGGLLAARIPDDHVPVAPSAERAPLLPAAARRPGVALALCNVGYAALAGFVVLHLERGGAGHGPLVFTAFAVAVVSTRLIAGRLPDRFGARRCAVAAAGAEATGLLIVAFAGASAPVAAAGAVLMGVGFSTIYPALALLVVEGTEADRTGTALGAFTAFFDLGVGLGAPLIGLVAGLAGYGAGFGAAAACAAAAGVAVLATRGRPRGPAPSQV